MANVTSISSKKSTTNASGLVQLVAELNAAFPERSEVVAALVTVAVAGEHAVMLGPPGTAKSALARALSAAFQTKSYFELLMTRFTTPEEVFGPVKLSGLQQDRFSRATAGYLPTAEVAFIDEIFKANSAILNALLTGLNERVFHDDGKPVSIPLVTCIAASNELPEGPELDALYDRFLVRVVTDYIADRDTFRDLLANIAGGKHTKVAATVDIRAEQAAAKKVTITDETIDALTGLRDAARTAGLTVSDRRWVQCLALVRAAAHVDGRASTLPDDLEILEHVLWRKPDERVSVARTIQTTVNPAGARAVEELDAARELLAKLPVHGSVDPGSYMAAIGSATKDISEILKRVSGLPSGRKVDAAKAEIAKIKQDIGRRAMRAAGIEL